MPKDALQAIESEKYILGAILDDSELINRIVDLLKEDDFCDPRTKVIYQTMKELYDDSKMIDLVVLTQSLIQAGNLDAAGGYSYISSLSEIPSFVAVEDHIGLVRNASTKRKLKNLFESSLKSIIDPRKEIDSISEDIIVLQDTATKGIKDNMTSLEKVMNQVDISYKNAARSTMGVQGLSTGFAKLDKMINGLKKGELIIIGARPGGGKSALGMQIAYNIAVNNEKLHVAVFSLEMSDIQIGQRLLSLATDINLFGITTGHIPDRDLDKYQEGLESLSKLNIVIDDRPNVSIGEIRAKSRVLKTRGLLDVIFVDYLQLVMAEGKYQSRHLEVQEVSKGLKNLAKELNVPIVALAQVNRTVDKGPEGLQKNPKAKKPDMVLADLRESGSIEQDADIVIFLDDLALTSENTPGILNKKLVVAKNRMGEMGKIMYTFRGANLRFTEGGYLNYEDKTRDEKE